MRKSIWAVVVFCVAVITLRAEDELTPVSISGTPGKVIANVITNKYYVLTETGSVYEVDGRTFQAIPLNTGGQTVSGFTSIAVDPTSNHVYAVSLDSDKLVSYNRSNNQTTIQTVTDPTGVLANPKNGKLYVACKNGTASSVRTYSTGGASLLQTRDLPGTAAATTINGMAYNIRANRVYVLTSDTGVFQINCSGDATDDGILGSTLTVGTSPVDIAYNPQSNKLYVTNSGNDTITICDVAGPGFAPPSQVSTNVGTDPGILAINQNMNTVFAANFGESGQVSSKPLSTIDPANAVTSAANTQARPGQYAGLAVNHSTNKLYVTSAQVATEIRTGNGTLLQTLANGSKGITVNPVTNRLVVTDSSSLRPIDCATHMTSSAISTGTNPKAVAVNRRTNKIYVANRDGNSVTIIDGAAQTVDASPAVGTQPSAIAVNEATNMIYVANEGSNSVSVINGGTGLVVTTVNVGLQPVAIAVNPVTNKVYVANSGSNTVSVILGATNAVRRTVPVGNVPVALLVNQRQNRIFVANSGSDSLTVIEGGTDEYPPQLTDGLVTVGNRPVALAQSTLNERVFVANELGNSITIVDGLDLANNGSTGIGDAPKAVVYNANNDSIYVVFKNTGSMVRASASNLSNTTTFTLPSPAASVAIDPHGDHIYAVSPMAGTVTVVHGSTNTSLTNLPVLNGPEASIFNPVTSKLYVACTQGAGSVVVVDVQQEANVPLKVTAALTTPTDPIIKSDTATINFTVTGNLVGAIVPPAPPAAAVDASDVYYQMDGTTGTWLRAAGTPGAWTATIPGLTAGTHVLYCFAVDGQHFASDDGSGSISTYGSSPMIGEVGALVFTIQNNNQPTIDPVAEVMVNEDSTQQTIVLTGITSGNANESDTITVTAAKKVTNVDVIDTVSVTPHADADKRNLVITFKPDFFNALASPDTIEVTVTDNGGTANSALDKATREFPVRVRPVNDPPVMNTVAQINLNEDSGEMILPLSGIGTGDLFNMQDPQGVMAVSVLSSNPGIINMPQILNFNPGLGTAQLRFKPNDDAYGLVSLFVTIQDNGPNGTGPNGEDHKNTAVIEILVNVAPLNDAPTLNAISDKDVVEDSGASSVSVTGITPGLLESGTLTLTVDSDNPALLTTLSVTSNGNGTATIDFEAAAEASGSATVTLTITDDAAGTGQNVNSVVQTFKIAVAAVNDAPSFVKGVDFAVTEASVETAVDAWATGIDFGPPNEDATQGVLQFILTPDQPQFFTVAPAIDSTGRLTFTPGSNVNSTVTINISVVLQDDGGTDSGGVDLSAAQSFTITLTPVIDSLVVTNTSDSSVPFSNSLRDCMARARSGDTITFDSEVFDLTNADAATVINVTQELPALDDGNVTIDAQDRRVTINGTSAPSACGLVITSSDNAVFGLSIVGFTSSGVCVKGGAQNNKIGGNRTIGAGPNGQGLRIGNCGAFGVEIDGLGTDANIVRACWLGLDASGIAAQPNLAGVLIKGGAAKNIIGGTAAGEGNVISGNTFEGVTISGSGTDDNTIIGNIVGAAAVESSIESRSVSVKSREDLLSGRGSVGNGTTGVFLSKGTKGSLVGGENSGEGNGIGNNGGNGVEVRAQLSRRNSARSNGISKNRRGGIALFDGSNDGVTAPTFVTVSATPKTTASAAGSRSDLSTLIIGRASVNSGKVEVFADPEDQGSRLVGRAIVVNGEWQVSGDVSDTENITATFTDDSGNTSSFAFFGKPSAGGSGGTTTDLDGDGVSDTLEILAGTDPANPADVPASQGTVQALKFSSGLNFAITGKDSIKASLQLTLPTDFVIAQSTVAVQFDGVSKSATLDAKGKNSTTTVALKLSTKKGATSSLLSVSIKNSDLRSGLTPSGLTDKTTDKLGETISVPIAAVVSSNASTTKYAYVGTVSVVYKAVQGKRGKAAKSR